jgi:hypothetical protein
LEGVVTLPNDANRFGPWAGKIVTGDEDASPRGIIYTVDTDGTVVGYDTTKLSPDGIHPEDFDIIPTNQSLYVCDYSQNAIVKFSSSFLTNYVGDLLVTEAGEAYVPNQARLFIIHWDPTAANFVVRRFICRYPNGSFGHFEHVTFAPIELPTQ